MTYLDSTQRSLLEKTVISARKVAEAGAANALRALAVDNLESFESMTLEQRAFRNRLRYKGRLLGDQLLPNGKQTIDNLAAELAYEYWHKMLFAKFLEVNKLLIHTSGMSVSMEECEELAKEEGYFDKWHAASVYASKMLPAIFRPEDPLIAVEFATEDRIKLEQFLENIPDSIYKADDSLGWVYQYWQSEVKARINSSGDKINGSKLPAVTQLFTEPYMVHFLIDNTIGAWWTSRNPGVNSPIKFKYLRLLEDGSPAGRFDGWPDRTADISSLDPCMGSGHFIIALFNVFVILRMYEEGLSKELASTKVITDNLHGLELDPRCTQIAAFNLALTVWKFCGHYYELPEMNLACSGVAPKGKKDDWIKLVGKTPDQLQKTRLENGIGLLFDHFQLAPELGSLLDPSTIKADAFTASFEELRPVLIKALEGESDTDLVERGVMAAGITKAGQLLSKKYTLQITNVPYLARGKQAKILADYCLKYYPAAKGNLATVFLLKMLKSVVNHGIVANVTLQDWLFQTTNKLLRQDLLKNDKWTIVARLGAKGFQTPMYDFNVMLICIQNAKPIKDSVFIGLDVGNISNSLSKSTELRCTKLEVVEQLEQLKNPDSTIIFDKTISGNLLLGHFAEVVQGVGSTDSPKYILKFWEVDGQEKSDWVYYQMAPNGPYISGATSILKWEDGKGDLAKIGTSLKGLKIVGRKGIAIAVNKNPYVSPFFQSRFDCTTAVVVPYNETNLLPIASYLLSDDFISDIRKVDQGLSITESSFTKVPFDLQYWQKIATQKYPEGLPEPFTNNITQWLFHGHPMKADNPLQVAVARMLGYRWPSENDTEMELAVESRELIKAIKQYDSLSDDDGIVCIPPVNGELSVAERLREFIAAVFGPNWKHNTLEELLKKEGSNNNILEQYLRDEYFEQHCKIFNNRPFIWQIWDGRKDGFSVLVNYHKLTKETLQKINYTYLGDWIRQCEAKVRDGESGADGLLSAAQKLKSKLELILEGEKPYDIFVRWKPLEKQPIGWDPDLNDGVRLNIRPFIEADVLRKKPKIKWGIDRGKNPPGSPWGEIRDNDIHLSLKEKLAAREKLKNEKS
jgi:hypothetical protein